MFDFALEGAWLIPLLPAIAFAVIGLFTRQNKQFSAKFAIAAIFVSFLLAWGVLGAVLSNDITVESPFIAKAVWTTIGNIELAMGMLIDPLTAVMLTVVTTVALLVEFYSLGYMAHDPGMGRFYAYVSLFVSSMLGLVLATSFFQMYVFWELVGLCSYLLIGFYYYKVSAREAAKKAFITTRIGDFGLLLGIIMLQIYVGTTDFAELQTQLPHYIDVFGTGMLTAIAFLLFIGPIGKSGQFPLHVWLPNAMEGPTPVSALIHAATMVVAGVYLIARAFFLFSQIPVVLEFIAWLGAFTAIFAASIAITQRPMKRILAYSTISQLGYMMLALGVGSVTASMFHLMTHAFFKALLFLGAGAVIEAMHEEADIFKMGGLKERMPVTCKAMTVGVLAIAGIPPFAGFFSKDEILAAAFEHNFFLFLIGSITAFMTAFYMARLLFVTFYGEIKDDCPAEETNDFMRYPLVILAGLSAVSGIWGYFFGFGEWVYFGAPVHEGINFFVAGSSVLLAVVAIWLAYAIYVEKRWSAHGLAAKWGIFYNLSYNKYYVDEFYTLVRYYGCFVVARILYWIDLNIVDGAINLLTRLVGALGGVLNKAHCGSVQIYIICFYGGVLIVMGYALIYAYKVLSMAGGAF